MQRRDFLKAAGAGVLAAGGPFSGRAEAAAKRPNVVYILADDLGYADVGCYGQKKMRTPCIDAMCREGMKLTQHYSGSTVCAPSRSCLMTGQHTGHTAVRGNWRHPLGREDATVAEVMKRAGYATGCVGKWGLGSQGTTGAPNSKGFDFFYGYTSQGRAHRYYPDYLWRNNEKHLMPGNAKAREHYCHDLFTKEAMDFIRREKGGPFFLYLPYTIPHVDLDVPEDSMETYYGVFGPEKPYKGGGYRGHPTPHAAFAGMVSRLDRDVGRIIELLQELGLDEKTLVVFTSDNGPTSAGGADPAFFDGNGPLRGIKRDLYEGGIRVPMIARWPGVIEPGSVSDHVSAFWDMLPTFAELAGADAPEGIDGISVLPTLTGERAKQKKHEYLYWEFYEKGGKQAVRAGDWKAVRLNVKKDPEAPVELYDLSRDLGEKKDLARERPDLAAKMAALMKSARTEHPKFPLFGGEKGGDKGGKKGGRKRKKR